MFANKYLAKNNNVKLIEQALDKNTAISIVIPCYCEPEILQTLESLKACTRPSANVDVIIIINHSEIDSEKIKRCNAKTKAEVEGWIKSNELDKMQFYAAGPISLPKKWAGAGLARKKGMDEALRRFNELEKTNGIIVSLDADTLVDKNYLQEIENYFANNSTSIGATIAFEHQKKDLAPKQLKGIQLYEQYLNYYKKALEFTGYPYSLFTIGSAFAVTALAYVKRGGMNRRQAGEDFYFLQNLVQMGKVGEITTTKVYPSSRLSDRVPFGTGPILQKWMNGEEDLSLTYHFNSFADLKVMFDRTDEFYKVNEVKFQKELKRIPIPISAFLKHDNFWNELNDLNKNCSSLKSFQTRFYHRFNAFKILKYLNFVHEHFYNKANLMEQVSKLEQHIGNRI